MESALIVLVLSILVAESNHDVPREGLGGRGL